jgi:hypothetical protein
MKAKFIPFLIMFAFVISVNALARDLSVRSRSGQSLGQRSFDESSAKSRGVPQYFRRIPRIDITWHRQKHHRAGIQSAFAGTDKQITALSYNSVTAKRVQVDVGQGGIAEIRILQVSNTGVALVVVRGYGAH